MQQYEKVAFIVKNKGVKCEKKLGKQAKRLTATIDAFTMRIKSKLFEQ